MSLIFSSIARARDEQPFILLLDSLNDPQNFGTLLRTAEAVGVHGVVIPLAHTVEVTPAVVNASSGASEHLRVARSNLAQAIDALKEENVWVVGLDQNGETIGEKTQSSLNGGRRSGRRERRRRHPPAHALQVRHHPAAADARPDRIPQCRCCRFGRFVSGISDKKFVRRITIHL